MLPSAACAPGSRCSSSPGAVSADENSNQSSLSDVYQLKVDSSPNSSPSPQQSESMSPAHTSDFRTDDSQPPTLGQETLEGGCWAGKGGGRCVGSGKAAAGLLVVRWVALALLEADRAVGTSFAGRSVLTQHGAGCWVCIFVDPPVLPRALPAFLGSGR